jgi:hypothetical protein
MNMELRILKELWVHFLELRILNKLAEYELRSFGCEPMNPALRSGLASSSDARLWAHFSELRIVKDLAENGLRSFGCEPMNPALRSGLASSSDARLWVDISDVWQIQRLEEKTGMHPLHPRHFA